MTGFIELYTGVMENITDSPNKFQEASALTIVSMAVGRKLFFISVSDARLEDILTGSARVTGKYFNIWHILIGKTRVSRKTTSIRWAKDYVEQLDDDLILPDGFTPQALVSELSKKQKNNETRALWINDEISAFFQQMKETKYMIKTDSILSKIYDCDDYKDTTISRGKEVIKKPYITILLASTDVLPKFFDENMMLQGFGNRFIYVIGVRRRYKPISTIIPSHLKPDCKAMIDWLTDLYAMKQNLPVTFTEEAQKLYISFEKKIEKEILDNKMDDIKIGYAGSLPTTVLKLACLYAVSDYYPKKFSQFTEPIFLVHKNQVQKAILRMKEGMRDYQKVVSMMRIKKLSKPATTDEAQIGMVYNIVRSYANGITKSELYRETNMLQKPLEETIMTLIKQDKIIEERVATKGRPKIMYKEKLK